jgi:hypothetical protein
VALWRLPRPDFHRQADTDFQDTPLALRPGDSLTTPKMALSVGFIRFVSSTDATQAKGLLTSTPVGLSPTEHLCFLLDTLLRQNQLGFLNRLDLGVDDAS